ncbi:MAG: SDR family oxidoreductase [Acetobacteraceae bacterium]|nr:SDR family oxidoreductase [Acetobacteraceae bacterium]
MIPKTALVTGGGKRLGRAIALALAEAGYAVAIHYNDSTVDAAETAADVAAFGVKSIVLKADLSDENAVRGLVPAATAALGPIGVLVNNASTFERDEWDDVTRASWDRHIEPNLRAPFVLMQDFARALPADAEGLVVNMLDERVWSLTPHFVSYTVSKMGLWGLTQSMALALAPRIRVNGIGPGPALPNSRQTQAQFDRQARSVPLQRGPELAEIGRAVLAMLELRSMTGQMIALDGGQHLQWGPNAGAQVEE